MQNNTPTTGQVPGSTAATGGASNTPASVPATAPAAPANANPTTSTTGNSHFNNNTSNNTHHNSNNTRGPRHYNNNNHYGGHNHHNSHHNNQHQQGGPGYTTNYGWAASQGYVSGYPAPGAYGASAYGYYPPNYYPQMIQQGYIHPSSAPQQQSQSAVPTMASPPPSSSPAIANSVPYTPSTHHKISIKNHNGETVTFAKAHNKSSSISSTLSTSPVVSAGKLASSPVLNKANASISETSASPVTAASPVAASSTPATSAAKSAASSAAADFMAKIRAKAQAAAAVAKKEVVEEPKKDVTETPAVTEEPKKEETVTEVESKANETIATPKEESKPEVVEPVPEVEKKSVESTPAQEPEVKSETPEIKPVTTSEKPIVTEPKEEEEKEEQREEEEIEAESKETVPQTESTEASADDEVKAETETDAQVEGEEGEESDKETDGEPLDVETISVIFDRIEASKNIENYPEFKYPDDITPSVLRSKIHKKIRYEPPFLLQFADKMRFPTDDRWGASIASKILIPTGTSNGMRGKDGKGDRSASQGGFGKNFGSKGPYAGGVNGLRGGPNQRDLGSRNGSRGGSKRGLGGRDKSKKDRNNSKKGSGRGNDQDGEDYEEKPAAPPVEVKPLEKSATRWIPRSLRKAEKVKVFAPDGVTELLDEEDVSAKTKSLLNKLTLENMEPISGEIIEIANQSKFEEDGKTLQQVIELIFAKACDEIHWSQVYAQLCIILVKTISPEIKVDDKPLPEDPVAAQQQASMLVRRFLILRCQTEYEKGWINKLPTDENGEVKEVELMSDEYYAQAATKRRGLGLARFIAELFVLGLLREKIIVNCLKDLTQPKVPTEADTETLDKLLRTAGKKLEGTAQGQMALNYSFNVISNWAENDDLPYKVRFRLMDLIDLKRSQWSLGDEDKGPKTIAEIHEADRKKLEDQSKQRNNNNGGRRGGMPESRQNSSRGNSKWGNESVSSSDLSNMGQIRNSSDRSLGPMSNFSKSKSVRQQIKEKSSTQSFTQLNNSSNNGGNSSSSSNINSQNSPATNLSREPSKRSESTRKNMFLHLDDEEESSADEEDGEKEEAEEEEKVAENAEGSESGEAAKEEEEEEVEENKAEESSKADEVGAKTEESIETPTDN